MPTKINCPNCNAVLNLPDAAAGKKVRCTKCDTPFVAPAAPSPEATIRPPIAVAPLEPTPAPPVIPQPAAPAQPQVSQPVPPADPATGKNGVAGLVSATLDDIKAKKLTKRVAIAGGAVLLILVVVLGGIFGGGAAGLGGTRSVDIRKVVASPREYAGQTLSSAAIMQDQSCYRGIGSVNSNSLMLIVPDELNRKAYGVMTAIGEFDHVVVEYRIWSDDEVGDIEKWKGKQKRLEEELSAELEDRLGDYTVNKAGRLSSSELDSRLYAGRMANSEWEIAELTKLAEHYKTYGWKPFQRDDYWGNKTIISQAFHQALSSMNNQRQFYLEAGTPEYEALTAEIEKCERVRAEFEARYEEIQAELAERAKGFDPEPVRAKYAEEDAAARKITEAFEEEADQRRERLIREANEYFNEECGLDFSGPGPSLDGNWHGVLVDVNIP